MPDSHPLGSCVRRFLLESVVADRNLSRHPQKSYRDAIRLLLRFITGRYGIEPTRLTAEDVNAEVVRNFLTYLEKERHSSPATANHRPTAIRSRFHFVSQCLAELVDLAAQVEALPLRKTILPTIPYLEKEEMDAVLAAPDRGSPQGQRDYALRLFLYNTGARADEAAHVTLGDLSLGTSPSVRILGKGARSGFVLCGPTPPKSCVPCLAGVSKDRPMLACSSMFAARPSPALASTPSSNAPQPKPVNKRPRFRKNTSAPCDQAFHSLSSAACGGRHQYHSSVAGACFSGDHQPLCRSRSRDESQGARHLLGY